MAPRLQSAALIVLVVLATVCSLHVDHVAATNCAPGKKSCSKNMRCNSGRNGLKKCGSYPNAIPTCKDGCCSAKCKPGYADCNRNMTRDGCETFIGGEDGGNCGGCGIECRDTQYSNAAFGCRGGKCQIVYCHPGRVDCNGKLEDGCEVDVKRDPLNCSSCGRKCPVHANTIAFCASEECEYACKDGYFRPCPYYGSRIDERGCVNTAVDGGCPSGQWCQEGVCRK